MKSNSQAPPSVMNIEVQPLGNQYRFDGKESDIIEVFDSRSGLRIVVSTWIDEVNQRLLEVSFRRVRGYRYLDEGDLLGYWQSEKLQTRHHVYEITSGGWSNGEALEPGILDVSRVFEIREWFISTTNGCMNVLSRDPPELKDLK